TAAQVQVTNSDAAYGKAVDQAQQSVQRVEERRQGGQLRADMAVDANHLEIAQLIGARVNRFGVSDGDAELVFLEAGGNVRMSPRVHVRVDPQGHRRA